MLQNMLLILVGAAFGGLIVEVIEAEAKIKHVKELSELKIEHTKAVDKNHMIYDKMQMLEEQVDVLEQIIIDNLDEDTFDIPGSFFE